MSKFQVGDRVVIRPEAIEHNQMIANSYWNEYTFEVTEVYPNWGGEGNTAYALVFGNYDGEPPFLIDEDDLMDEYGEY